MKQLLALASFALVLSFVLGADDGTEVVEVAPTERLRLIARNIEVNVEECWVTTSENNTYDFPPTNTGIVFKKHYCQLDVNQVKISFGGLWIITAITENGQSYEDKFLVKVTEKVVARPSSSFTTYTGQWVKVWLDGDEDNIKACNLTDPQGKVYDLMKGNIEGMTRYHGCGVRMKINEVGIEQWGLSQQLDNDLVQSALFEIDVLYDRGNVTEVRNRVWNLGKSARETIERPHMTFCQLTRPDGSLMPMIYKKFDLQIEAVTLFHIGTWRASCGIAGKMELEHIVINVEAWDLNSVDAKLIPGKGQELNLLCRNGVKSIEFCSFIRPDKKVINVPVGVGNEDYSYYGNGYGDNAPSANYYGDCGLTIHKPTEADYGVWTCEMNLGGPISAAIINVVKNQTKPTYRIDHPQVFVRRGDQFKVQCKINAPLDYCWLTSPNGTWYGVLADSGTGLSLKYNGTGLAMGECGAIVDAANATDDGKWTCHLGVSGSAEIEENVLVQVTDSYLIPVKTEVYAINTQILTCRTFLDEEGTLNYCRWIRPNGHGIMEADTSRYRTTMGTNQCELSILTLESDDIGQWTCVAILTRASNTEEWATIDVKPIQEEARVASVVSIVLGSGLLVLSLIAAFFAGRHVYKRRNSLGTVKSPPPYNPEDYEIPHVVHSQLDDSTKDKDNRY